MSWFGHTTNKHYPAKWRSGIQKNLFLCHPSLYLLYSLVKKLNVTIGCQRGRRLKRECVFWRGSVQFVLQKRWICTGCRWQGEYRRVGALPNPRVEIQSPLWNPKLTNGKIVSSHYFLILTSVFVGLTIRPSWLYVNWFNPRSPNPLPPLKVTVCGQQFPLETV